MTAIRRHDCGAHAYDLVDLDGDQLLLEPLSVDGEGWAPCPDGRRAEWVPQFGHREHQCVPEGQGELL